MPERGSSSAFFMEETLSLQKCARTPGTARIQKLCSSGPEGSRRRDARPGTGASPGVRLLRGLHDLEGHGILDDLRANPDIQFYDGFLPDMDREEKWEIRRRGMTADLFLTGVNAVSMKGTLHWVDMVGNRVAPVAFGPRHVILLAGANKLVGTPEEARERIRRIAPLNAKRHEDFKTPCMYTGVCADCNSPDRLCNIHMSIVKCFPKGRITVILTEESGGL